MGQNFKTFHFNMNSNRWIFDRIRRLKKYFYCSNTCTRRDGMNMARGLLSLGEKKAYFCRKIYSYAPKDRISGFTPKCYGFVTLWNKIDFKKLRMAFGIVFLENLITLCSRFPAKNCTKLEIFQNGICGVLRLNSSNVNFLCKIAILSSKLRVKSIGFKII